MTDSVDRLHEAVIAARHGDPASSRTARLLRSGRSKMAKKLAEEAIEVVIDAMHGNRDAVVRESADLLYNLVVLWVSAGVTPKEVWKEMERAQIRPPHYRPDTGTERCSHPPGAAIEGYVSLIIAIHCRDVKLPAIMSRRRAISITSC